MIEAHSPLWYAVSQVGASELPGNRGIPFERYSLPGEEPLAYCARFLRWCFTQAGTPLPGQRYLIGSVVALHEALRAAGALLPLEGRPEPGDLIFLRHRGKSDPQVGGHHVGIVELVTDKTVESVDANWGDMVQRVARRRGSPEIWVCPMATAPDGVTWLRRRIL